MPAPRYITTSGSYGAPGVYIREVPPPPAVSVQSLSLVGLAGTAVRGPVNQVVIVTGVGEFLEIYGGRDYADGGALRSALWQAIVGHRFGRMAICRVAAAAVAASETFNDSATPVLTVAASSPGAWGNGLRVTIEDATDGNADHFNLRATFAGATQIFRNLDISGTNDNTAQVLGTSLANYVKLTKVAAGRPDNAADAALNDAAGADGTIADTDFTGTGKAMELLDAYGGIKGKAVFGRSNTAVKTKAATLAGASNEGLWLVCPDSDTVDRAAAITDKDGLSASSRLVYCFNHARVLDPDRAVLMTVEPHSWMLSILGGTEDYVHPGVSDNASFCTGIAELAFNLQPGDYDLLTQAGVAALERTVLDASGTEGIVFADAPATSGEQLGYRLSRDFLNRQYAIRGLSLLKRPNSPILRAGFKGDVDGFHAELAKDGKIISTTDEGVVEASVDTESLNSAASRAAGIQRTKISAKIIPYNLVHELVVTAGTTVTVQEVS
jgi:hypothetical protein